MSYSLISTELNIRLSFVFEFGFLDYYEDMLPIVFVAILLGFIDKGDNPIVPDLGVG